MNKQVGPEDLAAIAKALEELKDAEQLPGESPESISPHPAIQEDDPDQPCVGVGLGKPRKPNGVLLLEEDRAGEGHQPIGVWSASET